MALQFHPYPFPQEAPEPDFNQKYIDPILRLTGSLNDYKQRQGDQKYRQFQMDMLKAKEAREAGAHTYEYGDPNAPMTTAGGFPQADPRMSLYQPATMSGETQFGNIMEGAQPDSMAPRAPTAAPTGMGGMGGGLMDRFRAWQEGRRSQAAGPDMNQDLTNEQLFAPGFGAKRREDYLKTRKSRMDEQEYERKGRETEADIKLKGAQADFYARRKSGGTGRYQGWTPQSLETRKRNLLSQLRYAPLAERDGIMSDIQEIDDIQSETLASYGGGSAAGGQPGANPKPILRPRRSPSAGAPASKFKVGQTAINPKTQEKLIFNGAGWVPAPVGR